MALISLIRQEVVRKRGWCSEEDVLDGIAFSSILPGPIAVNTASFIAYRCVGLFGALVALLGLTLPSFIMMIMAAAYYESLQVNDLGSKLLFGFSCGTAGIVIYMFYSLLKSQITGVREFILSILCLIFMFFIPGIWGTVACVLSAIIYGACLERSAELSVSQAIPTSIRDIAIVGLVLLGGVVFFLAPVGGEKFEILQKIGGSFASLALVMFGGGYVAIPLLKEAIVDQHQWLSPEAFSHAISLGQITPGPVLITSAFVGYVVCGLGGAIAGTIGMFMPTSLLMILASNVYSWARTFGKLTSVVIAFRIAAVGMIGAAAIFLCGQVLGAAIKAPIVGLLLTTSSFLVLIKWPKLSTGLVILGSGLLSVALLV